MRHVLICGRRLQVASAAAVLFFSLSASQAFTSSALAAGPPSVGLGTADTYGVLAGDTITNTGATTINGDLGLHSGTAVTGAPTVIGASNVANSAAQQAKADLRTAYLDAAGRTGPILVAAGALGGKTLAPGLYKDDGAPASLGIAGGQTLTLQGDASSVWIFQSASTLISEVGSRVVLSGGALACNVFWQVGSSATLKVGTTFVGTVMAHTSITTQTSVTVAGRLFAGASPSGAGALTLDTDTITKTHCTTAAEAAAIAAAAAAAAPAVTLADPGTPRRGSVALSATANGGSGIASVRFERSLGGMNSWVAVGTDWLFPYTAMLDTTGLADGLYDLRAVATDLAGNSTTSTAVLGRRLDNTVPTASITDPGANRRGTVTLASSQSDGGSGVGTVVFQRAPAGSGTWTTIPASWNTTTVADGLYDLRVVVTDRAGNSTTSTIAGRRVDNTVPTAAITDPGANLRGTVALASSQSDGGSGIDTISFQRRPAGGGSWVTTPQSFDTTTVADGLHDLQVVVSDRAGNVTASAPVLGRRVDNRPVDNIAPTAAITDPGATLRGTVALASTQSDDGSGIDTVAFQLRSGTGTWTTIPAAWDTTTVADGLYDLQVVVTDRAGNSTTSTPVLGRLVGNTTSAPPTTEPSAAQARTGPTPAGAAPINSSTDPARWTGMVEGSVGGSSECYDDLSDPMNPIPTGAICSSFVLEATQTGVTEVVVSPVAPPVADDPATPEDESAFNPDLNLFVFACDAPIERAPLSTAPSNPQLGCETPVELSGSSMPPGQGNETGAERVTFQAVAGVAYEILTAPGFAFVPTAYDGCAAYDDQCLDPAPTEVPGPASAAVFLQDCGPDTTNSGRRHVTGGGYFRTENDKKQHFSTKVNRKDGKLKGVLNFNDEIKHSRYFSKHITCASFNDTDKTVNYKGTATKKFRDSNGDRQEIHYCFSARARDGSRHGGSADEFEVSFFPLDRGANANDPGDDTCNAAPLGAETYGGPLYKGQVKYHRHHYEERCHDDDD